MKGRVRVFLHHEGRTFANADFEVGDKWQKFSAVMSSPEKDSYATLTFEFKGPGTLWIDNASLMPEKTIGGWRPDVVEAIASSSPA